MPHEIEKPPQTVDQPTEQPAPDANALRVIHAIVAINAAHVDAPAADPVQIYDLIADDRPIKLTGSQAGFERGKSGPNGEQCAGCWHYFVASGKARKKQQRGACEVVRPEDGNPGIEPGDHCTLAFSPDGVDFPLRGKAEDATGEPENSTKNSATPPHSDNPEGTE